MSGQRPRHHRRAAALAVTLLLGASLVACGSPAQPAAKPARPAASAPAATPASGTNPSVTVGYCCITPSILPLLLAEQKGMYKQVGVTVHLQRFLQGSATVAQALAAGQIDVATEMGGPDAVLRLGEKGAKIKMVATEEILDPVWLYAKKNITKVSDLKGKSVVVGGLGGPVYTYGILMLASGGLTIHDVNLIQNGNNQQRFALLSSGQADASTLSLPGNFLAENQGFHKLVSLGDVLTSAVEPWVASDKVLSGNREGVVRFLKAIHTADAYIKSHIDDAAQVYADISKTDVATARQSVEIFAPYYGWQLDMNQLRYVFEFNQKAGTWDGPMPTAATLQAYIDESLVKEIGP